MQPKCVFYANKYGNYFSSFSLFLSEKLDFFDEKIIDFYNIKTYLQYLIASITLKSATILAARKKTIILIF
jgi:hypothetical protein